MTDSEKWALWTLGVVALTTTAYFIFVALRGHGPAAMSVFALTALAAVPKGGHRSWRCLDERERGIMYKALLAGYWVMCLAAAALIVIISWIRGWDMTLALPVWKLCEAVWWFGLLMLAVRCVATLVLYRRGSNG